MRLTLKVRESTSGFISLCVHLMMQGRSLSQISSGLVQSSSGNLSHLKKARA